MLFLLTDLSTIIQITIEEFKIKPIDSKNILLLQSIKNEFAFYERRKNKSL